MPTRKQRLLRILWGTIAIIFSIIATACLFISIIIDASWTYKALIMVSGMFFFISAALFWTVVEESKIDRNIFHTSQKGKL